MAKQQIVSDFMKRLPRIKNLIPFTPSKMLQELDDAFIGSIAKIANTLFKEEQLKHDIEIVQNGIQQLGQIFFDHGDSIKNINIAKIPIDAEEFQKKVAQKIMCSAQGPIIMYVRETFVPLFIEHYVNQLSFTQ